MLKFIVDESSGSKVAEALGQKGYDTIYCGKFFPGCQDEYILKKAENDGRIIITNDKDFGELMFRLKKPSNGVMFLRLKVDRPDNRIKFILEVVNGLGEKLEKKFVLISESKIRIRQI